MIAVGVTGTRDPIGFGRRNGYHFTFAKDIDGVKQYGAKVRPHTAFIDRGGNLVEVVKGGLTKQAFEAHLAKILN